jgi:hypothetical protein
VYIPLASQDPSSRSFLLPQRRGRSLLLPPSSKGQSFLLPPSSKEEFLNFLFFQKIIKKGFLILF